MKRTGTSLFSILSVLLLMQMVSCGEFAEPTSSDTNAESAAETFTTESAADHYGDALPDILDYSGYDFRVLIYEGGNTTEQNGWRNYVDINETNGEILNDAAFARNAEVEERLNVAISCHEDAVWGSVSTALAQSVLAGDDMYDLMIGSSHDTYTQLISERMLYDVNDMQYVNLSQPYYSQSAVDTYALSGHHYLYSGAYTYPLFSGVYWLFNKTMWETLDYADPYQTVRDGKWTADYAVSLMKGVYNDVNGNNKVDMDDIFGFSTSNDMYGYFYPAFGLTGAVVTEDGFVFDYETPHAVDAIEKAVEIFSLVDTFNDASDPWNNFFEGRSLMMFYGSSLMRLRDLSFDFGFLPTPKYDEAQKNYYSYMCGGIVCSPITITSPERTGAIIEALFSASDRYMKPSYIENFVENKVLRDEGSVEMYYLLLDTAQYEFTRYISPNTQIQDYALPLSLIKKKSTDLVSGWAKIETKVKQAFDIFYSEFLEGEGQ